MKNVELCEIDGLVIEASKKFLPTIAGKLDDTRVKVFVEDAIEYIKDKKACYDVVLIDSTDPMGPGEGLFTEEFYTNVKNSLKKGGIMAAQSESPFTNKEEIKKSEVDDILPPLLHNHQQSKSFLQSNLRK